MFITTLVLVSVTAEHHRAADLACAGRRGERARTSVVGTKRTCRDVRYMVAIGGKADMERELMSGHCSPPAGRVKIIWKVRLPDMSAGLVKSDASLSWEDFIVVDH